MYDDSLHVTCITRSIEKIIRKRNRIYARRKNMQRNFEHSTHNYNILDHKCKALKKDIQQKLRNAHWSYVENIITPLKNENETQSFYLLSPNRLTC